MCIKTKTKKTMKMVQKLEQDVVDQSIHCVLEHRPISIKRSATISDVEV